MIGSLKPTPRHSPTRPLNFCSAAHFSLPPLSHEYTQYLIDVLVKIFRLKFYLTYVGFFLCMLALMIGIEIYEKEVNYFNLLCFFITLVCYMSMMVNRRLLIKNGKDGYSLKRLLPMVEIELPKWNYHLIWVFCGLFFLCLMIKVIILLGISFY